MKIVPFGRLGGALDAAGLAPTLMRDTAWRATLGGAVALLTWQALVACLAIVAYIDRTRGASCRHGPLCTRIDAWSDGTLAAAVFLVLTGSLGIIIAVGRIALALRRGRFWAGVAARLAGWVVALGGLVFILVGGLPWLALGVWLAFWAKRLRYDPPAWAKPLDAPPGPPPDPLVIEGERA